MIIKKNKSYELIINKIIKEKYIFITGTDTGIGKTYFCENILRLLEKKGYNIGYMKPFCSGDRNDIIKIKKIIDLKDNNELINPEFFKYPLAPFASTLVEQKKRIIDLKNIFNRYESLKKKHKILIIEGIGGIYVPIMENYFVLDFIKQLNIPVILVSSAKLGTINQTCMNVNILNSNKIKILGIILNYFSGKNLAEKTNPYIIEKLTKKNVYVLKNNKKI